MLMKIFQKWRIWTCEVLFFIEPKSQNYKSQRTQPLGFAMKDQSLPT